MATCTMRVSKHTYVESFTKVIFLFVVVWFTFQEVLGIYSCFFFFNLSYGLIMI